MYLHKSTRWSMMFWCLSCSSTSAAFPLIVVLLFFNMPFIILVWFVRNKGFETYGDAALLSRSFWDCSRCRYKNQSRPSSCRPLILQRFAGISKIWLLCKRRLFRDFKLPILVDIYAILLSLRTKYSSYDFRWKRLYGKFFRRFWLADKNCRCCNLERPNGSRLMKL